MALITGAGQGNGRAIALGLAQAGARVIATDMNERTVGETARLVRSEGGEAWPFVLDVSAFADCENLAKHVAREIGVVDLLVNNAGIIIREGSDSSRAVSNWRQTLEVNLHGTFNVTQALLPGLRGARGTVVNIASIAAYAGQATSLGYSPSKGAIKLYTQSLAAELAKDGVRVNALAPGVIETPMTAATRAHPERLAQFMGRIPMGRLGQPEDLAGPVVFLSSRMSEYITGVTLPVDGGFLAV